MVQAEAAADQSGPRSTGSALIPHLLIIAITLLAFFLRTWRLDDVPPGWRDDELINSLVISQKALDGDIALYYPDASGHESLFHLLTAVTLALFGPGAAGIRLLPALLGTLTVPLTYIVASRLFGRGIGLLAAACLAVSFWSLMYSRIGIRHISTPLFMLIAFYFLLRGLRINHSNSEQDADARAAFTSGSIGSFLAAGLFVGLGFYTYFASRGIPIIIISFLVYLALFQLWRIRSRWPGLLVMAAVTLLLALPLILLLNQQPEAEARVSELAVPITDALDGDFSSLFEHTSRTLRMFLNDGDDEWLYNIPFRPVFTGVGALFFWSGLAVAFWYAAKPLFRWLMGLLKKESRLLSRTLHMEAACAFLLLWWLGGIAPGFISVPAASLGHTIIAQSPAYIILALPLAVLYQLGVRLIPWRRGALNGGTVLSLAAALILLTSIVIRDIPDYFQRWSERGMVRFLYRADIKELTNHIKENPTVIDFGVSGLLAGPWDRLALEIELQEEDGVNPRWFNPERAAFLSLNGQPAISFTGYPVDTSPFDTLYQQVEGSAAGGYHLSQVVEELRSPDEAQCFRNGLCLEKAQYDPEANTLDLVWGVGPSFSLPEIPLISNPPPPGIYSGPRLLIFAQLLDQDGGLREGDDGLWVDPTTLHPGDRFIQQHRLENPGSGAVIIFGLYDPMDGQRYTAEDGSDYFQLDLD